MDIEIRPVTTDADLRAVYPYQCGYSDIVKSFETFALRVQAAPDLYLAAFDGETCVGHLPWASCRLARGRRHPEHHRHGTAGGPCVCPEGARIAADPGL